LIYNIVLISKFEDVMSSLMAYLEVTKPRLWLLLIYTGIAGYIIASHGDINVNLLSILLIALITGTSGANVVTSYIDRDIDSVMNRTRLRPLPSRRIYPAWKALVFGLILIVISLFTSLWINIIAFIFMVFGLVDNIIIYSAIFKRKNPINIIIGSFSGGAPAIIGYAAYTGSIDIFSLIIAALIVLWTPVHIWSLALYFKDDYKRANIPMLPVVISEKTAIRCIASTALLLVIFTYIIPLTNQLFHTWMYYLPLTIMNIILLYLEIKLLIHPDIKISWKLFKFSSPYLGIVFTIMMLIALL